MYPAEWHRIYGDMTGESARRIVTPLVEMFGIRSLVEVGCGNAHWTQAAIDAGVTDYRVVDGPWNNRDHLLVDRQFFIEADLSLPLSLPRRFDMALCTEVAEHVSAQSAETLVASLTGAADVVAFGAAIPLQGGYGHINEQWPSYWRDIFGRQGYRAFDLVRPRFWTDRNIHYWYRQNMFVYVRQDNADAICRAEQAALSCDAILFDAVHPEKYQEMASYQAIAARRLVRRLPGWALMRLRAKLTGKG